ncbi:ATP-dependent DNA helicase PIF1-like protein [Tanacetum coccineum]
MLLLHLLAVVYVIEFQKHGLPQAHILLWIEEHCKCKTPGDIDDIILAELPSPTDDPTRYKAVTDYMCNVEGKCSKHFPKPFYEETIIDQDGYPVYHRRDNVVTFKKALLERDGIKVTMFTDWFALNERHPPARDRTIVYSTSASWERYFMQMLLNVVRRSRNFEELLTDNKRVNYFRQTGRTTHSRFVIPLELLENSTCGIKHNTHLAKLIQEVELIIWDEAPMTQKYAFEALDKTLRDILSYPAPENKNKIFGGLTVLLGIEQIVAETYPNFIERQKDDAYLRERAILTLRNDDADAINIYMFDKLEGESVTYNSAGEICKASTDTLDQQHLYPIEFLNTLNFPGMPPHALSLKKELPIMLLRNVNPSQGLCNGTRLIITEYGEFVLKA